MVAANIAGARHRANYEAVPRVTYTDPQAAAVGAVEAQYSAGAPVSEVPKTATYTHAYAESNGFLTLLSAFPSFSGIYEAAVKALCMTIMDMPLPVRPMDAQMATMPN